MNILTINKRASHDYAFLETYEAGIVLSGQEVKSIKNGSISIKGAFITFSNNEPFLAKAHISPYKNAKAISSYDPERPRKLLLKKREIISLLGKKQMQGLTIIPIKLYTAKRGLIKIQIALAKGKKIYDKRKDIAKKESDRRIKRLL
jgi:SsrA-binding protein